MNQGLTLAAAACLLSCHIQAADKASSIEYERSPGALVVAMSLIGSQSSADPPLLQIFGDGSVVVSQPAHSPNPGVHKRQISDSELNNILLRLEQLGVMKFDHRQVQQRIDAINELRNREAAAAGRSAVAQAVMDGSTVVISVNLTKYKAPSDEQPQTDRRFRAEWYEPQMSSEQYPEIHELSELAQAATYLGQLVSSTTNSN
jgi:hypothetical protein